MAEQFNVEEENEADWSRFEESIANDKGSQPVREHIEYTGRPPRVNGPDLVTEGSGDDMFKYNVMCFVMVGIFTCVFTGAVIYLLTLNACKP